jgi:hypothetical protein
MNINPRQRAKAFLNKLFQSIKHGDQEHQDWLENKIDEFEDNLERVITDSIEDYNNT